MKIIKQGKIHYLVINPLSIAGQALLVQSIRPALLKEIWRLMNRKGVTQDLVARGWSIEAAYSHIAWEPIFRLRQIKLRLEVLPDINQKLLPG